MSARENAGRTSVLFAAHAADEARFDVGEPGIVAPAVSAGLDVMAAAMIAAVDQHVTDAGCAHLAEGDLLRAGHIPAAAWTVGWLCVGTHTNEKSPGRRRGFLPLN